MCIRDRPGGALEAASPGEQCGIVGVPFCRYVSQRVVCAGWNDLYGTFAAVSYTHLFPQELIQSVDVDAENWKTTLTFANGSTYVIPTLGTSLDNLILSSTVDVYKRQVSDNE